MLYNKNNLIWIDLEMTGLNPEINKIIEIATLVTDNNLNIISEGPNIVIYQNNDCICNMDSWNNKVHTNSGLISKVKNSIFDEKKAENITLNFLSKFVPKNTSPICGSTVAQDRRFLFKYMPYLESYFNYRYIDVSSLKELVKRWFPKFSFINKNINKHSAIYDIKNSIKELIYYRKIFFNNV